MNGKKEYIAPELTMVSFKCENGYAASGPISSIGVVQTLANALTGLAAGTGDGGIEFFNVDQDNTFTGEGGSTFTWE